MSVVIRAVVDHSPREIDELRAEGAVHIEKAAAAFRRAATLEAMRQLAAEHLAAENGAEAA